MSEINLSSFDSVELDGLRFCSMVYELFEKVRQAPDGVSRLRLRPSKLEKRLLEELLPIAAYLQHSYRAGRYIKVCWQAGSQPFDARIFQHGSYVELGDFPENAHLEVTCAVHPNEHMQREHLEKKGGTFGLEGIRRLPSGELISEPVVGTNGDFIAHFSKILIKEIIKKSKRSYPENTSLIVECVLNSLYTPSDWCDLMSQVQKCIPKSGFREVFFHNTTQNFTCMAYPPQ